MGSCLVSPVVNHARFTQKEHANNHTHSSSRFTKPIWHTNNHTHSSSRSTKPIWRGTAGAAQRCAIRCFLSARARPLHHRLLLCNVEWVSWWNSKRGHGREWDAMDNRRSARLKWATILTCGHSWLFSTSWHSLSHVSCQVCFLVWSVLDACVARRWKIERESRKCMTTFDGHNFYALVAKVCLQVWRALNNWISRCRKEHASHHFVASPVELKNLTTNRLSEAQKHAVFSLCFTFPPALPVEHLVRCMYYQIELCKHVTCFGEKWKNNHQKNHATWQATNGGKL